MIEMWKYPAISELDARKHLHALETGDLIPLDGLIQQSDTGESLDFSSLDELSIYFNEVRGSGSFPRPMGHKSHQGGRFKPQSHWRLTESSPGIQSPFWRIADSGFGPH